MLRSLSAVRPAARAGARAVRALSSTARVASAHGPEAPKIYGPGGKPGEIPSNWEQATGLERLELLGDLQGIKVFDDSPLDSSRIGTKKDPIMVPSFDVDRIIGCTGSPADSHHILWFHVRKDKQTRCTECGSVYQLDYITEDRAMISLEPPAVKKLTAEE
ncbi:cytochrome c oxidase subunit VB-domain-containing protein [Schizophyllum amplum]|uniref:Cytochrome c oxidase subunit 4, mitochondrial n=1 Tax=Schizophyllum amplum TaxID=97359 RepID=A0A550CIZ4_9AGAR|nr:cytochrome c oxidase subunit VB-domain-containing protein [Auriculariopsis ampla]